MHPSACVCVCVYADARRPPSSLYDGRRSGRSWQFLFYPSVPPTNLFFLLLLFGLISVADRVVQTIRFWHPSGNNAADQQKKTKKRGNKFAFAFSSSSAAANRVEHK